MTDFSQDVTAFSELIDIPFNNLTLLEQALTHRSFVNENKHLDANLAHNERLEFLGDAVIEFIAGDWLYQQFPDMREGQLTRLRSALVRTEMLAEFALACGIDQVIRLGVGEEANNGRQRNTILCDAFEAVVGAIYLDQGEAAAREFIITPFFENALPEAMEALRKKDNKSRLQEWIQAQPEHLTPTYHTLAATGPDHAKEFVVEVRLLNTPIGWGCGRSKREAEHAAAQMAIDALIPSETSPT